MDLFSHSASSRRLHQPLAERMRPQSLEELAGQEHLVGPGRLLAQVAAGKALPSLILWGPPGTGKTTVARILGRTIGAQWIALSAVSAGVKEVREAAAEATARRDQYGERTLLFIDEIHRFSKSQQDALLPHVEAGTLILVGATTENPSFGVISALLSRCKVVRLESLGTGALAELARRALADGDRGLGELRADAADEVVDRIVQQSDGDARRMYNTLEVAAQLARADADRAGTLRATITDAHVEEAGQQKTLLYDKAGDEHYGVVSAFIKSMRGSDPDAAVYWMTRMLEAGEDPRFVIRRMVIFAAEDVGVADPQALGVATAALAAYEFVGMPEGVLPLTQACLYLATAPKTNTALTAYANARKLIKERGPLPVPKKLRNAPTALAKAMGHGDGYKYPHDFAGHYVPEDYLPDEIAGASIYQPSETGAEAAIKARLAELADRRRRGG